MKKLLYILLAAVVVLLALIGSAYLYLSSQEEGQLRARIETALEAALDRDVSLAGPLTVDLAPLPTVTLRDVTVANPAWATNPLMLSAGEVRLQPALWTLLTGDIVLRHVFLRDTVLSLENDTQGRASWRFSGGRQASGDTTVAVGSAAAANVTISYLDAGDGVTREMTLESLQIGAGSPTDPMHVELDGELLDLPWSLDGHIGSFDQIGKGLPFAFDIQSRLGTSQIQLDGTIENPDFRDWTGISIRFDVNGERPYGLLAWTRLPLPETTDFKVSGALISRTGRLALTDLSAEFGTDEYRLGFTGEIGDLPTLTDLRLEFVADGRSPADIVPWADPVWLATDNFQAGGTLTGTMPDLAFESIDLEAEIDKTLVRMSGHTSDLMGVGDLDLSLQISGENVGAISRLSRIPIPDVDVFEMTGRLTGTWADARLSDVDASMREASVRVVVAGGIDDLNDLDGLRFDFDLEGGDLDDLRGLHGVPELIETDRVTARGAVTGDLHDLTLVIDDARLQQGSLILEGGGRLIDLVDAPRLDVRSTLTGTNVRELTMFGDTSLPATDRFRVTGRLVGSLSRPDLMDMDARASLGNINVQLSGALPDVLNSQRFEASGMIRGDDVSLLGAQFDQTWPETRSFNMQGQASGTWQAPVLTDLQGSLVMDRMQLQLAGRFGDVMNGRDVDLVVQASAPSLNPLLGGDSAVLERLGEVTAEFRIAGGPGHYDLDVRELRAGSSLLKGEFDIIVDDKRLTRLEGNPVDSRVDLSPWFLDDPTAPGNDAAPSVASTPPRLFNDTPLPVEWLQGLDVTLDLSDVDLTIGGSVATVLRGHLDIDDGEMDIGPLDIQYEEAKVSAAIQVKAGPVPSLVADIESKDFDMGSLIRRAGGASNARGKVDLEIDLTATGHTVREMAADASGRWAMLMTEGFLGEFVLNLRFSQMLSGFLPLTRRDSGVTVVCGILDIPIDHGVARAHLLVLDTPEMLMRGRGTVDLGQERYDLLLKPRPKRGRALGHHANVRVRGSFRDPKFSIDASGTTTRLAGAVGRFALLGPAGLFVSTDTFREDRQECAESLAHLSEIE